jgi:acetylornithine deacetylase
MPAHRGGKFWRIHVEGRGAHGGVKYHGVSAAEKGMVVYRALVELEKQRNKKGKKMPLYRDYPLTTPVCVGKFNSGRYISAVPEECVLEGTIEFLPGEELEDVKKEFEHAIKEACEKDPWLHEHQPGIEWFGLSVLPSEIPPDHPLVQTFEKAHRDMTGEKAVVKGFQAGCDMRIRVLYNNTPSLLFGPGDLRYAHRINEHIEIEQLVSYTKTLALGILGWSGVEA